MEAPTYCNALTLIAILSQISNFGMVSPVTHQSADHTSETVRHVFGAVLRMVDLVAHVDQVSQFLDGDFDLLGNAVDVDLDLVGRELQPAFVDRLPKVGVGQQTPIDRQRLDLEPLSVELLQRVSALETVSSQLL